MSRDLGPGPGQAQGADLALAAAVAIALVPTVLLGWTAGRVALGRGAHRWHLAIAGAIAALPLIVRSPRGIAAVAAADAAGVVGDLLPGLRPSWAVGAALL